MCACKRWRVRYGCVRPPSALCGVRDRCASFAERDSGAVICCAPPTEFRRAARCAQRPARNATRLVWHVRARTLLVELSANAKLALRCRSQQCAPNATVLLGRARAVFQPSSPSRRRALSSHTRSQSSACRLCETTFPSDAQSCGPPHCTMEVASATHKDGDIYIGACRAAAPPIGMAGGGPAILRFDLCGTPLKARAVAGYFQLLTFVFPLPADFICRRRR